uniref:Uncharacterized protein n=1 Tax=Oryza brachyantha TaxID=4533 RepID=J3MBS5_ORYBR
QQQARQHVGFLPRKPFWFLPLLPSLLHHCTTTLFFPFFFYSVLVLISCPGQNLTKLTSSLTANRRRKN